MSDEIKKGRSPSAPRITLQEAIEHIKKLHQKAGKSPLPPVVAAQALGYGGLNGAALGLLAALKQYGLLDAERGESVSVSPLALRLVHPLNAEQEASAKREAALKPKEFAELFTSGHHACPVDVLTNHLIQNGFTADGAKRAASVFKDNEEFAKLSIGDIIDPMTSPLKSQPKENPPLPSATVGSDINIDGRGVDTRQKIREYRFLLDGDNEVEVRFFGDLLGADQVEGLMDYLEVMKKRLTREGPIKAPSTNLDDY